MQCIQIVISRRSRCSWNILKMSNASLGILPDRYNSSIHISISHLPSCDQIFASAAYDDTIKLYIDEPSDDWFTFATFTEHTSTVWVSHGRPPFPTQTQILAPARTQMTLRDRTRTSPRAAKTAPYGCGSARRSTSENMYWCWGAIRGVYSVSW